ncbi:DinB family protein [Flavobacterium sp. C4GT6]|uniref:DinB family protein n=1 Tax=Flavobacterium sp. C4GT6 TaxID=3103818 RepID=UPI002ED5A213
MKDFFKEMFEYTFHFNEMVINALLSSEITLPEKSLKLINHTINAHEIWNHRIEEKLCATSVWGMRDLNDLKSINKNNYNTSIEIVESYDFSKILSYKNSKGDKYTNTVKDILFHIVNHSTYHRGQIASDCKEYGITPLVTDYIFYKR